MVFKSGTFYPCFKLVSKDMPVPPITLRGGTVESNLAEVNGSVVSGCSMIVARVLSELFKQEGYKAGLTT